MVATLSSDENTAPNFAHNFATLSLSRCSCGMFHRSAPF